MVWSENCMVWSEIVWFQIMNLMVWVGPGVGQSAYWLLAICASISEMPGLLLVWNLVVLSTITMAESADEKGRFRPAHLKQCQDNKSFLTRRNLLWVQLKNHSNPGYLHKFLCISLITMRKLQWKQSRRLAGAHQSHSSHLLGPADITWEFRCSNHYHGNIMPHVNISTIFFRLGN